MPYPGTPLYERLEREGRLLCDGKWWLHPEYRFNHAAFVPDEHDARRADRGLLALPPRLERPASIFRRMWDFKTHLNSPTRLAVYLAYNPLYAREAFRKQGMWFGRHKSSIHPQRPAPLATAPTPAMEAAVVDEP